jgi:uncharacterized protein YdhG (YjbR/CyaY superfamily)
VDTTATTIDEYLGALTESARATLGQVRSMIRAIEPEAVESISYGMPTYKYRGKLLIYFAAAKQHLGLYGTRDGTVRFPHDQPPTEAYLRELIGVRKAAIEAGAKPRRGRRGESK